MMLTAANCRWRPASFEAAPGGQLALAARSSAEYFCAFSAEMLHAMSTSCGVPAGGGRWNPAPSSEPCARGVKNLSSGSAGPATSNPRA